MVHSAAQQMRAWGLYRNISLSSENARPVEYRQHHGRFSIMNGVPAPSASAAW